jgi:hypothetical protein
VAAAISLILSNPYLALFVVAIITTRVKASRLKRDRRPFNVAYVLWGELLFYTIGLWFVFAGLLHAYFQGVAAPQIGWQPSPFEYELGWIEIPLGVVAMMSLWRGFEFRLASTIVVATFALAAAAQHVQQMMCCANYAPSNAGLVLWFADVFLPMLLVVLAALSRDERGADRR